MSETTVFGVYYVNIKTRNQRSSEANERTVSTLTNVNANEKQTWRHKMSSERKYREKKNIEKQKYAHLESEGEPNGYRTNSFRISCYARFSNSDNGTPRKKVEQRQFFGFFFSTVVLRLTEKDTTWRKKVEWKTRRRCSRMTNSFLYYYFVWFLILLVGSWLYICKLFTQFNGWHVSHAARAPNSIRHSAKYPLVCAESGRAKEYIHFILFKQQITNNNRKIPINIYTESFLYIPFGAGRRRQTCCCRHCWLLLNATFASE